MPGSRPPYGVTMWGFSWVTRRCGDEAEYANWDTVLDELVERGYGCVRIDALPQLIAAGPDGRVLETATILPQDDHFLWGNHTPVEIAPATSRHVDLVDATYWDGREDFLATLCGWMDLWHIWADAEWHRRANDRIHAAAVG